MSDSLIFTELSLSLGWPVDSFALEFRDVENRFGKSGLFRTSEFVSQFIM